MIIEELRKEQKALFDMFKIACIKHGVTQSQIAKLAGIGPSTLQAIIKGALNSNERAYAAIKELLPSFAKEYLPKCDFSTDQKKSKKKNGNEGF